MPNDLSKALALSDSENVRDRVASSVETLAAQFGWTIDEQICVSAAMIVLVRDSLAEAQESALALVRQTFAEFEKSRK